MSKRKRFLLLGSILLIMALVFTFSPTRARTAAAAYSVPCPPTQNTGSNNTWVQVIQFNLDADFHLGIVSFPNYPLATDGDFGPNTATAVHDYQTSVMKIAPGAVGASTWSSLGFCDGFSGPGYLHFSGAFGTYCPGGLSEGSSGTWVRALQQILNMDAEHTIIPISYNNDNWWPLALDGSFGPQTKTAVEAFQYAQQTNIDGSVGNQTWALMAMCHS